MPQAKQEPLMLSAAQHHQLKQNLAHVLRETFSIDNQSDGKLEYLAARLMGFTNHQQRQAKIREDQDKARRLQALLRAPATLITLSNDWPEGVLRTHNGEIPADDFEILKSRGWFDQETGGGYRDLEIEFRYEGDNKDQELSFNLRLSIDDNDKLVHIIIGGNRGDGFNEHVGVAFSNWEQSHDRAYWEYCVHAPSQHRNSSRQKVRFSDEFSKHEEAANCLLDEIQVVITWLRGGPLPKRA